MKTVTIPTSQSPFVVMVNGAKYVYPAGSVQDVPDEVAVVIEAHNKQTAKPNEPVEAPFDCDCGGGGGTQPDWNQTDSSAADFIKNKPFGDELVVILEEQELAPNADIGGFCAGTALHPIQIGDLLAVKYDGVLYECEVYSIEGNPAFGNATLMGGSDGNGEPFCGMYFYGMAYVMGEDMGTANHTVGIVLSVIEKLPQKYYTPQTVVYVSAADDVYIYTDAVCTTKATAAEIKKAMRFGLICIHSVTNGTLTQSIVSFTVLNVGTYCEIYVGDSRYYTAEYTPRT